MIAGSAIERDIVPAPERDMAAVATTMIPIVRAVDNGGCSSARGGRVDLVEMRDATLSAARVANSGVAAAPSALAAASPMAGDVARCNVLPGMKGAALSADILGDDEPTPVTKACLSPNILGAGSSLIRGGVPSCVSISCSSHRW